MIKAMNIIISNGNSYPIFTPNQVLTDQDLNRVVLYLDSQNRLTRTHLIGMGIITGLEGNSTYQSSSPASLAQIHLSAGCGITSEGDVISLVATTLTHYRREQAVPSALFAPRPHPNATSSADETADKTADETAEPATYKVLELFAEPGRDRLPLHEAPDGTVRDQAAFTKFLANQTLIVLYELQDEQRDSCLLDCDDRGKDRRFRLRYFLLPRYRSQETEKANLSAEALLRRGFQMDQLAEPWNDFSTDAVFEARNTFFKTFYPRVQRFGYGEEPLEGTGLIPVVRLSAIVDYTAFLKGYYTVCLNAIEAIDQSFPNLFQLFSPFFASFHPLPTDFSELKRILNQRLHAIVPSSFWSSDISPSRIERIEAQYALQYFYDYLSQLVAAYRELAETAFDLMDDGTPDSRRFPRFLLLGQVSPPNQTSEPYTAPAADRSHFTQAPIYNGNSQRVKQVRYLYDRLVRLCAPDSFYLLPFYDTPLKITPSTDRSTSLSEQAIPYYLNYPNLYRVWNYDAYRKGRIEDHPAYFYPTPSGEPFIPNANLVHRLDDYPFYRIEGHLGEANGVALQRIQEYKQRYNLPFDVITLKLGDVSSLNDLNISGQLDDLNADFGRMKDTFQKLWLKSEEDWSRNVFLHTLKRVFFDQPNLSTIKRDQIFNPIVLMARSPAAYEFAAQINANNQSTGRYHLYVRNAAGTRLAAYTARDQNNNLIETFDFSGLSDERIAQEQKRIAEEMAACLTLGQIIYGVERQTPNNPMSYYVQLSTTDQIDVPIDPITGQPNRQTPVGLRSLNYFSVDLESNRPNINQPEFQDFETLYGLLRDVPEAYATENNLPFQMGDRLAADSLNYFELKGLMEAYEQRLEQLMELHLFHKFVTHHPGLEHLGGVPKGGTFVLVYVDGREVVRDLLAADRDPDYQARTAVIKKFASLPPASPQERATSRELLNREDIVVADFCLPYRCCSDTPTVSYVITQPRPIVLLEKTLFCAGDDTRYEFILDPLGGTLRGEGSFLDAGKYYFQPSRIQRPIVREVAITITYVVEGSYDTLSVTIHPLPDASFQVGERSGERSRQTTFCANDAPVSLNATQPGGTFRAIDGQQDISAEVIQTQSHPPRFNPAAVNLDEGSEKAITLTYTVTSDQGCTSEAQQRVTVFAQPDARFRVGEGTGRTTCCSNDDPIPLIANQPGGMFRALNANGNPIDGVISGGTEGVPPTLIPSEVNLGEADQVQVTIEHTIVGSGNCTNQDSRTLTVHRAPVGNFRAEIVDIDPDGFTVRVFNIRPPNEPSFNLVWTHPGGDRNQPDADSNEFTIRYPFNFDTWDEGATVAITLRVVAPPDRGGCQSQPITRRVDIPFAGVRAFNLLTIRDNQVVERTRLENDRTFNRSDFDRNDTFTFAALTVPDRVGSVVFTYTPPNGNNEILPPVNNAPYRMPDGWQPRIGTHTIKAEVFRQENGTGDRGFPLSITLRIRGRDGDGNDGNDDNDGNDSNDNRDSGDRDSDSSSSSGSSSSSSGESGGSESSSTPRDVNPSPLFSPLQTLLPISHTSILEPEMQSPGQLSEPSSVQPSSIQPIVQLTIQPSIQSTIQPTIQSTIQPLIQPSEQLSIQPSVQPPEPSTIQPSVQLSTQLPDRLLIQPPVQPAIQPPVQPSERSSIQSSGQIATHPALSWLIHDRHLSQHYRAKLPQLLTLTAAIVIITLGWTYFSRQTPHSPNSSPSTSTPQPNN
ncbi:MAG: hypothetical protein HC769_30650 [Cyanobacteria bacterium CRU_2_1]|nr:hypothetical protein [Cyanobacteria bacterium CRU_2_1]